MDLSTKQYVYIAALALGLGAAFGVVPYKYAFPGALALILGAQFLPDQPPSAA